MTNRYLDLKKIIKFNGGGGGRQCFYTIIITILQD